MDNSILVDTSVWVEYFRKKQPFYGALEDLIEQDRVCTISFIAAEILQGARSEMEFMTLRGATEIFHLLEESPDTWIESARLSSTLRQKGQRVGLGDCYIATMAHRHGKPLWSLDKHFEVIQKELKIVLYKN